MELTPGQDFDFKRGTGNVLLIACGALAREMIQLIEVNQWQHLDIACLPAKLHNTPKEIPEAVRAKIHAARGRYDKIYVAYGDCGTGGQLDKMLEEEGGIERIGGPHCYSFFSGNAAFEERHSDDMRSFFLTDYLCRHFDKLVWEGLGLNRHADMVAFVFGNYEKLLYIAQVRDPALESKAETIAARLGLSYEYRFTGFGELQEFMQEASDSAHRVS